MLLVSMGFFVTSAFSERQTAVQGRGLGAFLFFVRYVLAQGGPATGGPAAPTPSAANTREKAPVGWAR